MIHLVGEYYAEVDPMNFTLLKHTVTKNNNDAYKPVGYVGKIEDLIQLCIVRRIADKLGGVDCELTEALAVVKAENTKTRELIRKAIGESYGLEKSL